MNPIACLVAKWKEQGIACPAGVALADVRAFEDRYHVLVPPAMREYFLTVNGMGPPNVCDDDLFNFFPLQDLITVAERLPDRRSTFAEASKYFMFADHSISLPTYAIRLSSSPDAASPVASVYSDF